MKKRNLILAADYYKETQWLQTPDKTEIMYAYLESRGGKFNTTLVFGLQAFVQEYLEGEVIEQWMIEEADAFLKQGFGFDYFNRAGWQYIVDVHGGKLPIKICAVKEGTVVATNNVLVTIENTDEKVWWLTDFLETILLRGCWYPITVATLSYNIRKLYKEYCDMTGCAFTPFYLNDFGARGVSSGESAGIGGMAHLTCGIGTDTIEGILAAQKYYKANVCGYSVFASQHSTTCAYGKANEIKAYEHFLNVLPDDAIGSFVIDSFDTVNAVKNLLGGTLKDRILARKGKIVFRPDSGDPVEMSLTVVSMLYNIFGGTINDKGFKVLNPKVSCIYGDGVDYDSIRAILHNLFEHGFATNNIIFGSGGALLQASTRDTQRFAVKCSAAKIDGKWVEVFKAPITDSGKVSKRGRLALTNYRNHEWNTLPEHMVVPEDNKLELVFQNGKLIRYQTFDEIRNCIPL